MHFPSGSNIWEGLSFNLHDLEVFLIAPHFSQIKELDVGPLNYCQSKNLGVLQ